MLVNAGDNGRMLGVNGPQCVAIVGEVEFDGWQTSVSHRRRSLRSAAALGLPPSGQGAGDAWQIGLTEGADASNSPR